MTANIKYLLFCLILGVCLSAKAQGNESLQADRIDEYIQLVQDRYGIPGIALAIVKDGELIHRKNYGKASIEHNVPITDKSIFRVYSLSKPIITTGLFQLMEKKKLRVEDEVGMYLKDLPESWTGVKIKHLLSHSSGLPDIKKYEEHPEEIAKEKIYQDDLLFPKGAKYSYNQSNYWLVQRIIENLSGKQVEDFILEGQFPAGTHNSDVFFSTDSRDIVRHRVTAYFSFAKGRIQIAHPSRDRYLTSCNGLNISLDQFIEWDRRFNQNSLIKASSKANMWDLFPYSQSSKKFVYGWDQRILNDHVSYGFSGSLITAYRIFPEDKLSIIFLSNGLEHFYNIENVINHLASLVDEDIVDRNNHVFETLYASSLNSDLKGFKQTLKSLENTQLYTRVDFEQQINTIGYMLLNVKQEEKSIAILTLNTQKFPSSWNTFDSLGEAFQSMGNFKKALKNYKKALVLNIENEFERNDELKRRIKALEGRAKGEN